MSTTTTDLSEQTLWGHPKGLYTLFFTEMWERFSYYGMRALLTLYMVAKVRDQGLGWTEPEALALYGWYTMSVYVASVPGGWIADRLLGQKNCVVLGGLFLCAGHGVMAIPAMWAFYAALVLIVIGVGLLKPNISTMVGGLYKPGDARRDKGFAIFYMGINLGALLATLIVGYVGEKINWHYGFGLAGIGMLLGQIQFMYGRRYLKHVGNFVKRSDKPDSTVKKAPLTKIERDRIVVLLISFLIVIVFWGAFEQAGGLMSIYTMGKVDRFIGDFEVPAAMYQSLNSLYIILFATVVAGYWYKRQIKGKQASAIFKMAIGTIIMGLGFVFMVMAARESAPKDELGQQASELVIAAQESSTESTFWSRANQALSVMRLDGKSLETAKIKKKGDPLPEGEDLPDLQGAELEKAMAALELSDKELQQAREEVVAPLVAAEAERILGDEPNVDIREAVAGGLSTIAVAQNEQTLEDIAEASHASAVYASAAAIWLILAYLFHTIGELCSSPVSLSFITKLSPAKYAALMMGIYFAATGFGSKLAGLVGEQVANHGELEIFAGIAIFTVIFASILLLFLKPLNRMTHGAEDITIDDH